MQQHVSHTHGLTNVTDVIFVADDRVSERKYIKVNGLRQKKMEEKSGKYDTADALL